ncbi:hypothetical protein SFHH103_03979 (plasmid) [Sinorhizobium fredii HH103]|uniref:Uncharacterized protein n=1 Tax=Sinorhizobium fredii (strain HH103) TaxID=1117943 RepID=G9ABP1_SINF1|nr:hypothetical protein SFHH103_03979 [Sinorhizobium fredii HH103]
MLRTTEGNAAEYLSKQLRDREMYEDHETFRRAATVSFSSCANIVMERLVLASELQKLPDLAQSARSCEIGQREERCGNMTVGIDGRSGRSRRVYLADIIDRIADTSIVV